MRRVGGLGSHGVHKLGYLCRICVRNARNCACDSTQQPRPAVKLSTVEPGLTGTTFFLASGDRPGDGSTTPWGGHCVKSCSKWAFLSLSRERRGARRTGRDQQRTNAVGGGGGGGLKPRGTPRHAGVSPQCEYGQFAGARP